MKILITGGIGFIGTNCAIYFSKKLNHKISIIDSFARIGVKKNAAYLQKNFSNIKIIESEISDISKYSKELKTADVIVHLAGQTAVTTSINDPLLDFNSNLKGGFYLLEAVRKNNPKAAILYSSTNKVYGDLKHHKIKKDIKNKRYEDLCHPNGLDENEKIEFISPYGCSKGSLDFYFQDYHRIFNLNTVVFRQSCIYGPFQIGVEDQGWVAHFSKQFLKNKFITMFGNGYQVRDLLYVEDLIRAYDLAIKNIKKVKGQVFNVGGGIKNSYSLLQVVELLEKQLEKKAILKYKKERLGDQKYFVSANKKIRRILNWVPKTQFPNGLKKLIDWQNNNLTMK